MANYYTAQSIANYNDDAPADDGTESEANRVKYATIKTELADPVKTLVEGIDSELTNMESRLFLNSSTSQSTNYTIQSTDLGKLILASNGITVTALAAATAGANFVCGVLNTAASAVTIAVQTGETLNGTTDGTLTLAQNNFVILWTTGSGGWRAFQSIPALLDEDDMSSDSATAPATQQSVKAYVDSRIVLGTEQATTSGTDIDFTSIPSWVKRITINFVGVSQSSTGNILIQLGNAGGIENTGYLGSGSSLANATQTVTSATSAFLILSGDAAAVIHGSVVLTLEDAANFTWVASGSLSRSDTTVALWTSGSKSLSAALTQVRVTPTAGNWDAGAINILYD